MNKDVIQGNWKQLKGKMKEQWGKLTDDELDRAEGKADQLIGLLQKKYGYARDQAEQEYNRFNDQWGRSAEQPPGGTTGTTRP